jgi:hypothetical protein
MAIDNSCLMYCMEILTNTSKLPPSLYLVIIMFREPSFPPLPLHAVLAQNQTKGYQSIVALIHSSILSDSVP